MKGFHYENVFNVIPSPKRSIKSGEVTCTTNEGIQIMIPVECLDKRTGTIKKAIVAKLKRLNARELISLYKAYGVTVVKVNERVGTGIAERVRNQDQEDTGGVIA